MKSIDINSLVRDNVKRLKPYASARDEFKNATGDYVFLDANESPNNTGYNRYPDPQQVKLKQVLADLKGVNSNQILLGNGSDEVLDLLFRAFCEPGKNNVVGISPSYGMYQVLADINNIEYRKSLLLPEVFKLDLNDIFLKVDNETKLVFLCSPNNPTGQVLDAKDIERVVEEFNGLVIIDEAYIDFCNEPSWIERFKKYNNIVVTQTLSKAYGLAGIRLGVLYASEQVVAILNKIKPPYNISQLTQEKAYEFLIDKTYSKKLNNCNSIDRAFLCKVLVEVGFVLKTYHSDSNFILIKVTDANQIYKKLIERGIVVRNRTNDDLCENCLRITIGSKSENEKLIQVMKSLKL